MHGTKSTSMCLFLLSFTLAAVSQSISTSQTQLLSLSAQTAGRSNILQLNVGDAITVTGTSSDPQFAADIYVYDSREVLVGKDDEDSVSAEFQWQCVTAGNYYVLARNPTGGSGSIQIAVSHPRAPVSNATPPEFAQVKVFYATDRNSSGQTDPNMFYGVEPDGRGNLRFGEATVSIPRDHKLGELEGPSIFRLEFRADPSKHIVLQSIKEEELNIFMSDLARRVSHSQHKEALVFIHGFNNTFADAARRTAQIAYDLGFDGPAILYSWPSQGEPTLLAYNKDARNADLTVDHLREFLDLLVARTGATTIHVIAHSMGSRPLTAALVDEATHVRTPNRPSLDQVIFMAPDIDAAKFKQMAQHFRPSARRFTLYVSAKDTVLTVSHSYAGYARAGEGGKNMVVVSGIDTIDASAVDTSMIGLSHQYYADNSTVLSDVFHVIRGDAVSSRFGLHEIETSLGPYWQFYPATR